MTNQQHIRAYVRRLAKEFKPEKVILFDSYAYGSRSQAADLECHMFPLPAMY